MGRKKAVKERLFELENSLKEVMPEVHRQVRVYIEAMKKKLENTESMSDEEIADIRSTIQRYEKELSEK